MCETRFNDLNQRCDKICTRQFETLLLPLDWETAWRIGTNLRELTLLRMNGPMQSQQGLRKGFELTSSEPL